MSTYLPAKPHGWTCVLRARKSYEFCNHIEKHTERRIKLLNSKTKIAFEAHTSITLEGNLFLLPQQVDRIIRLPAESNTKKESLRARNRENKAQEPQNRNLNYFITNSSGSHDRTRRKHDGFIFSHYASAEIKTPEPARAELRAFLLVDDGKVSVQKFALSSVKRATRLLRYRLTNSFGERVSFQRASINKRKINHQS